MHQVTHPTKEQVRAYMRQRELAHRPPPAPAEIRRQLSWQLSWSGTDLPGSSQCRQGADFPSVAAPGSQCLFLPETIGRLAVLLLLEWSMHAAGMVHED